MQPAPSVHAAAPGAAARRGHRSLPGELHSSSKRECLPVISSTLATTGYGRGKTGCARCALGGGAGSTGTSRRRAGRGRSPFDVEGGTVRVYLKHDSLCPLVPALKADPERYGEQFRAAVGNILALARSLPPDELAVISAIPEPDCDLVAEIPLDPGRHGGP